MTATRRLVGALAGLVVVVVLGAVARASQAPPCGACGLLAAPATVLPTLASTPAATLPAEPTSSPPPTAPPATPPQTVPPAVATSTAAAAPSRPVDVGPVVAIGDSVTLDIATALADDISDIAVDGRVGRQFAAGVAIVENLRQSGRLPRIVVIALGTNGTVSGDQVEAMMQAAAGSRVVLVTVRVPRSWQDEVNATLRAGAARHPGTLVADWFTLSAGHPEWFAPDGYHLEDAGAAALADLITGTLIGPKR